MLLVHTYLCPSDVYQEKDKVPRNLSVINIKTVNFKDCDISQQSVKKNKLTLFLK